MTDIRTGYNTWVCVDCGNYGSGPFPYALHGSLTCTPAGELDALLAAYDASCVDIRIHTR